MALVSTPGLIYPPFPFGSIQNSFLSTPLIDATGEKIAMLGRVWWPGHTGSGTKNIDKIGFLFGTVTKAGGSALTVSLQNPDLTSGPPVRPDGTQDQTVAIANADAGFVSNAWYDTASLSAQRTVAFGEQLYVVWEYDGAGRLGADSVIVRVLNGGATTDSPTQLFTTSWAAILGAPNVLFHFSDGSFGGFANGFPINLATVVAFSASSNPDEWAAKITMPYAAVCEGAVINVNPNTATAAYDVVLYASDGSTVVAGPVSVDGSNVTAVNSYAFQRYLWSSPVTLSAGGVYYVAPKPTVAGQTINFPHYTVASADHFQAHPYGTNWHAASRVDGGSWTDVTDRRHQIGLLLSHADLGGGGGNPFGMVGAL